MALDAEVSRRIYSAFNERKTKEFCRLLRAHPEFLRHEDGTDRWMWQAAMKGNLPMIQALIDLGMNVNEPKDRADPGDPHNQFCQLEGPILQAAGEGHVEIVRWLLEHGAKINYIIQGKSRCLPLTVAAMKGHLDVVKLLVKHGADFHSAVRENSAITLAEDYGQYAVRDYLNSLGARTLRQTTLPDNPTAHKRFLSELTDRLGPLGQWRLEIPGCPLVTLYLIPPSEMSEVQTLFTVGLSDHRLPQGQHEFACSELRCILPPDWPLNDMSLKDPNWNWPVTWIERVVRDLRTVERWPDATAVFMNGDPPLPLAPNTLLCGWVCLKSLGESVQAPDYRWIDIHSLFPIYIEELTLIRQSGYEELVRRFQAHEVPLYIDPKRPNMATDLK